MNYRQAKIVLNASIFLIILLCVGCIVKCSRKSETEPVATETPALKKPTAESRKKVEKAAEIQKLEISSKIQNHSKQFNDLNEEHLQYATKVGIKPINQTRDIWRMNKPIIRVESCKEYEIDNLTHSYPYLVEPATLLLHDIGAEFNAKLAAQGGGNYKIKVTSLLRTTESVNRLKKGNVNSTENSAHLYGTTFDISYVDFPEGSLNTKKHTDGDLKNLLAEILLEMREQGRCLVKFERKQGCFHVTSTGK